MAPTISSITPRYGPIAGGNTVVITGAGFTGVTSVEDVAFELQWAFALNSDSEITAVVASGATNALSSTARVVTPDGQDDYTYYYTDETEQPVITSISPDHGPHAGGTNVTVDGTALTSIVNARFGTVVAVVESFPTHLIAVSPFAQGQADIDVVVETALGVSNPVPFTFDYPVVPSPAAGDVVNEIINPSFEYDVLGGPVAGWADMTVSGYGPVTADDAWAAVGARSAHAVAASALFALGTLADGYGGVYPGIPWGPGPCCGRWTIHQAPGYLASLLLYFVDDVGGLLGGPALATVTGSGEGSFEGVVAPDTTVAALFMVLTADAQANLDRVQFHHGAALLAYADGDMPEYHWEGVPGASRTIAGAAETPSPAKAGAALRVGDVVAGQGETVVVQEIRAGRTVKFIDGHSRIVRRSERVDL